MYFFNLRKSKKSRGVIEWLILKGIHRGSHGTIYTVLMTLISAVTFFLQTKKVLLFTSLK